MTGTQQLVQSWRSDAAVLRRRGAVAPARILESCASELEAAIREAALASLSLPEAARESGYSTSGLRKRIKRGELRNVGVPFKPRVLRSTLPHKGRPGPRPEAVDRPDVVALAHRGRKVRA